MNPRDFGGAAATTTTSSLEDMNAVSGVSFNIFQSGFQVANERAGGGQPWWRDISSARGKRCRLLSVLLLSAAAELQLPL